MQLLRFLRQESVTTSLLLLSRLISNNSGLLDIRLLIPDSVRFGQFDISIETSFLHDFDNSMIT